MLYNGYNNDSIISLVQDYMFILSIRILRVSNETILDGRNWISFQGDSQRVNNTYYLIDGIFSQSPFFISEMSYLSQYGN